MEINKNWIYFIILSIVVIDQLSKIYVKLNFNPGEVITFFDFINITYVENNGMAFGVEPFGKDTIGKLILTYIRMISIFLLGIYLFRIIKNKKDLIIILGIAFIFSGAIGNFIDNAFYDDEFLMGKVVDMIYFELLLPEFIPYIGGIELLPFVFNIADTCIFFGFILIITHCFKKQNKLNQF